MSLSKTQNTIEVENIEVVYKLEEKNIHAVKDASFNVTERKMLGIIGETGSGKSSLIRALNGLIKNIFRAKIKQVMIFFKLIFLFISKKGRKR